MYSSSVISQFSIFYIRRNEPMRIRLQSFNKNDHYKNDDQNDENNLDLEV